jgi:hypothetical protein
MKEAYLPLARRLVHILLGRNIRTYEFVIDLTSHALGSIRGQ